MSIRFPRIQGTTRVLLLAGMLALPLAACNSPSADMNRSLESVRQPVVQRNNFVFDVSTLPGGGLSVSERSISATATASRSMIRSIPIRRAARSIAWLAGLACCSPRWPP